SQPAPVSRIGRSASSPSEFAPYQRPAGDAGPHPGIGMRVAPNIATDWASRGQIMAAEPSSLLVVDDEELNREGLARRLQRHGYDVTPARSGREAIELLGGRRFDLVLLDIMMPGM